MSESFDVSMSEGGDAMFRCGRRLSMLMGIVGFLKGLPGMLLTCLVILFPLLLRNAVGMRRNIVQFGSPLVVFVMRSVAIASGHI
jgi:hypothetical protein